MTHDLDEAIAHALSECVIALRPAASDRERKLAAQLALVMLDRLHANGGERVPVVGLHESAR